MNLLELPNGRPARIIRFKGGEKVSLKLAQYGIFIGDLLRILRSAPFKGPVLLSINGREIALGRGIAAHILVEVVE